jgi:hypothetical protein
MNRTLISLLVLSTALVTTGAAQAAEIAGAINANGTRQVKSPQYTVSHPSAGRYIIHFTQAFPTPYVTCIFMPVGALYPSGLLETTKSCDVTFINSAGKLTNALFNFLAVDTTD